MLNEKKKNWTPQKRRYRKLKKFYAHYWILRLDDFFHTIRQLKKQSKTKLILGTFLSNSSLSFTQRIVYNILNRYSVLSFCYVVVFNKNQFLLGDKWPKCNEVHWMHVARMLNMLLSPFSSFFIWNIRTAFVWNKVILKKDQFFFIEKGFYNIQQNLKHLSRNKIIT